MRSVLLVANPLPSSDLHLRRERPRERERERERERNRKERQREFGRWKDGRADPMGKRTVTVGF